jgi:hypothetical protein
MISILMLGVVTLFAKFVFFFDMIQLIIFYKSKAIRNKKQFNKML